MYSRDSQTDRYQEHPVITSGLSASYGISHKPRFPQERQEPSYYPYSFHPPYQAPLGGRSVYWGIEEAGQTSSYQQEPQLHNLSVNYHCDYGVSFPHHRADGPGPVSPYYRGHYEESTRQFHSGDASSFYGSRQYCGANTSEYFYVLTINVQQNLNWTNKHI